jgi:hypothetical protein
MAFFADRGRASRIAKIFCTLKSKRRPLGALNRWIGSVAFDVR